MGGLDPAKIFLLLVIALVVVGPERLPGAARQLGGMWRELNRMREKFDAEVRAMVPDLDLPKIPTSPSKAVSGYISGLVSGMGESTTAAGASASETVDAFGTGGGSWTAGGTAENGQSTWRPLVASQEPSSSVRRAPAVPSWPSVGRLSADTRSADTVFVFDEPSMN
ncbi:MAG: twin-arginine translocase TatA/TatE family subunit [Acidimicrobiales bacterium]|jgi:Sec-independent protein translocase protein TatA